MSYLHLSRTRTRERSLSPPLRSIIRHDTKRSRVITLSDDEDDGHDDYPYSSSHRPVKTSRALTIRDPPSQLERYNIWNDRHKNEERDQDKTYERIRPHRYQDDDADDAAEEHDFRLKVAATFSRPRMTSSHHHHHEAQVWPGDTFRRKEKYLHENWETRERSRSRSRSRELAECRDSFWGDSFWGDGGFWGQRERESDDEKVTRYRKIKRTKTEEWTPLRGWRRVQG